MYTDFYNFTERPFDLNPSPRFLYLGEIHREALAFLTYGVVERKGFVLLTGDVGTGKTTMIRALLANLDENVKCVFISNPLLPPEDFLRYLAFSAFKKRERLKSKAEFLIEFEDYLRECLQHQQTFVLVVDEAHKLSFDLLEEIRLLSNMETTEDKLGKDAVNVEKFKQILDKARYAGGGLAHDKYQGALAKINEKWDEEQLASMRADFLAREAQEQLGGELVDGDEVPF